MGHDAEPLRCWHLPSGLDVLLYDATSHYFGGYYHVRLEVRVDVPLQGEFLPDPGVRDEARRLLGDVLTYRRRLERMAVLGDDVEAVRGDLVQTFEAGMGYLGHPDFCRRFVAAELAKVRSRVQVDRWKHRP